MTGFRAYYEGEMGENPPVVLKMRNNSDGSVSVLAVDVEGERHMGGDILRFNKDGTLTLMRFASRTLGITQSQNGSIKVVDQ